MWLLAALLLGCGDGKSPPDAVDPPPETDVSKLNLNADDAARLAEAVAIARAVREDPDNLAGMLDKLSMTHDEMRVLFRTIAADPAQARAYELLLQEADQ